MSIFDGIARKKVGRVDLVAHSVGILTPALSALGTGLLLPAIVGPGFWISTLLGFGLAWLLASTFGQFSSRFNASGSLYTYVAKGLGPSVALIVGVAMVLGYGALIGFGVTAAGARFESAWLAVGGVEANDGVGWLLLLLCVAVCLVVIRRGIAWSTRVVLVVEVLSVVLLCAVFATWVTRYGMPGTEVFSLVDASASRIFFGAATIATLTVAFESSAMLGLESDRPFGAVPWSMKTSLLITGIIFFAANIVGTVRPEGGGLWSGRWFGIGEDVSPLDGLALIVLGLSLLALALAAWTALARLLFSFAREGALWRGLGRTSANGFPTLATWAVLPIALAVPFISWATGGRPTSGSWNLLMASTVIMCITYGCAAAALLPFLRKLDEVRPLPVLVSMVAICGVAAVAAERIFSDAGHDSYLALVLLCAVVALGVVWRWALGVLRPGRLSRVGAHEESLVSEVFIGESPHGDGRGVH